MSKYKKLFIIVAIAIIIGAMLTTISSAKNWNTDPSNMSIENIKVNDTVIMNRNWALNNGIYCIYHGQLFGHNNKYKAVSKINITGNTSTDQTGKKVNNWHNAKFLYILSQATGKGLTNGSTVRDPVQAVIWMYMKDWVTNVGTKHGIKEGIATAPSSYLNPNSSYKNESEENKKKFDKIIKDAENYANGIKNETPLKNNTNKDKVKAEAYEKNNTTYFRIGPLNYSFSGKLSKVELTDEKGKTVNPTAYGKFEGSTFKEVQLGSIKSGNNFYVIIPANGEISNVKNIKVGESHKVKTANIVFWDICDKRGSQWQNVIQFNKKEETKDVELDLGVIVNCLLNISGHVWEDQGKIIKAVPEYNDIYDTDESPLEGITVRLIDKNGNIIKNKDGKESITTTDKDGNYKFTNLLITEDLQNYLVEFEYNGLTYTSVKPLAGNDDKVNSKAGEKVEQRKKLNEAFTEITNAGDISDRSHGYSRNAQGESTGTITYNNDTYNCMSTFNSTDYDNKTYSGTNLTANTDVAKYSIYEQYQNKNYIIDSDGVYEIQNINLGLVRREMPQMSITSNIKYVDITLNNYNHTYEYVEKSEDLVENSNFNVRTKFYNDNNGEYKRGIYPSDIQYSAELPESEQDNKLRVYVTYAITVKNSSNTLSMSLNELVNYYDNRCTITESWIGDDIKNKVEWKESSKYGQNYKDDNYTGAYTQSLAGTKINSHESLTIFIKYQVSDDAVLGLLNQSATLDNVSEVYSYSTYYGNDAEGCKAEEIYAGIDKLSAPGNAKMELDEKNKPIKETYEADTDNAPSLLLEALGSRDIEGTVFEDDTMLKGNERNGDGIYDAEKENTISGVNVELLKVGEDGTITPAKIYPPEEKEANAEAKEVKTATKGIKAETKTENDGHYIFRGVEPDNTYFIRYTYSNGETKVYDTNKNVVEDKDITVQNYKSTIIVSDNIKQAFKDNNSNLTWYKEETRYSDARDDYIQREAIDKDIEKIDSTTGKEGFKYNSINATTPRFAVEIEYKTTTTQEMTGKDRFCVKISNIDFGIAERARPDVIEEKEVKHIKVTLPNGQVLVDGDPKDNLNYVSVTKNNDKIEEIYVTMDNELIYGSHLEIEYGLTLTNSSELDYKTEDYYYYGYKDDDDTPIAMTGAIVLDYVDSDLTLKAGQEEIWSKLNIEGDAKGFSWNLTPEQEQELLNKFSTVVKTEQINGIRLEPNKSTTTYIMAEKLLSTEDTELVYENTGEVVQIVKEGGGLLYKEIPVTTTAPPVIIVPPTGSTNHNVMYAIIGLISLAILGAGTFGIRKFLKK